MEVGFWRFFAQKKRETRNILEHWYPGWIEKIWKFDIKSEYLKFLKIIWKNNIIIQ
jgi:hypothetical protein